MCWNDTSSVQEETTRSYELLLAAQSNCSIAPITSITQTTSWYCIILLVGGLEHEFYFFHLVGNVIIPTGPNSIIFQRGGEKPPTSHVLSGSFHVWKILEARTFSDKKMTRNGRESTGRSWTFDWWISTMLKWKLQRVAFQRILRTRSVISWYFVGQKIPVMPVRCWGTSTCLWQHHVSFCWSPTFLQVSLRYFQGLPSGNVDTENPSEKSM
jgi:hypothetical protein